MLDAFKVSMLKPENGATLQKTQVVDGVITVMPITTPEEKTQRRLEVKARSTLMIGIPNENQLKFKSTKDAKQLLEAVEKRFKMLDQTFNWHQKLESQLELLGEKISQDVNQKLLRSLSPEWNTYVVVWKNKADLDTMSMDDLYNNLKALSDMCIAGGGQPVVAAAAHNRICLQALSTMNIVAQVVVAADEHKHVLLAK
nr:hypothetical protein [Tanacetum cinerariifolium]